MSLDVIKVNETIDGKPVVVDNHENGNYMQKMALHNSKKLVDSDLITLNLNSPIQYTKTNLDIIGSGRILIICQSTYYTFSILSFALEFYADNGFFVGQYKDDNQITAQQITPVNTNRGSGFWVVGLNAGNPLFCSYQVDIALNLIYTDGEPSSIPVYISIYSIYPINDLNVNYNVPFMDGSGIYNPPVVG